MMNVQKTVAARDIAASLARVVVSRLSAAFLSAPVRAIVYQVNSRSATPVGIAFASSLYGMRRIAAFLGAVLWGVMSFSGKESLMCRKWLRAHFTDNCNVTLWPLGSRMGMASSRMTRTKTGAVLSGAIDPGCKLFAAPQADAGFLFARIGWHPSGLLAALGRAIVAALLAWRERLTTVAAYLYRLGSGRFIAGAVAKRLGCFFRGEKSMASRADALFHWGLLMARYTTIVVCSARNVKGELTDKPLSKGSLPSLP